MITTLADGGDLMIFHSSEVEQVLMQVVSKCVMHFSNTMERCLRNKGLMWSIPGALFELRSRKAFRTIESCMLMYWSCSEGEGS